MVSHESEGDKLLAAEESRAYFKEEWRFVRRPSSPGANKWQLALDATLP